MIRIIRLPKKSWYPGESDFFTITVDDQFPDHSVNKLLDAVAFEAWGGKGSAETVLNRADIVIRQYSCPSHGGFMVMTGLDLSSIGRLEVSSAHSPSRWPKNFEVRSFEEDQEWAELWLACSEEVRLEIAKHLVRNDDDETVIWRAAKLDKIAAEMYPNFKHNLIA